MPQPKDSSQSDVQPATPERWPDLAALFGPRGACQDCWCLFWRVRHSEFNKLRPDERRQGLKALVDSGELPGLLAYSEGQPVGWCAVAPRAAYDAIEHSRNLKRVDEQPCWVVPCPRSPIRPSDDMRDLLLVARQSRLPIRVRDRAVAGRPAD